MVRIDAETRRQILSHAEFVEAVITKALAKQAGYGAEGVAWLDAFAQRQHEISNTKLYDQIVSVYGSYFGECFVRNVGGEWVTIDGVEAVAIDMNNAAFPFTKLRKQLKNGREAGDSVLDFYNSFTVFVQKTRKIDA